MSFVRSGPVPFFTPSLACGWGASMGRGSQYDSIRSTLTLFTLYNGFKRNIFAMSTVSTGGNPFQGQPTPCQVLVSYLVEPSGSTSLQGQWNPFTGMSQGVNPFLGQSTPMRGFLPSHWGSTGGKLSFPLGNQIGGHFPSFNQRP